MICGEVSLPVVFELAVSIGGWIAELSRMFVS